MAKAKLRAKSFAKNEQKEREGMYGFNSMESQIQDDDQAQVKEVKQQEATP
jgi:hypothetical protein